jgi:hypothetical protein
LAYLLDESIQDGIIKQPPPLMQLVGGLSALSRQFLVPAVWKLQIGPLIIRANLASEQQHHASCPQ